MGGRGHRLWLGFRLRLGVETPEGDEAGRSAADEAFFCLVMSTRSVKDQAE